VRTLLLCLLVVAAGLFAAAAQATVYSPWVLSENVADTRDVPRFAADRRWAHLRGQDKALAVWRYLVDPVTGTWHYADTSEGRDPNWESRIIKDPIKDLNVYGFAVCSVHACMVEGLYEGLGFGVRQLGFGGYHRVPEVEWDGRWHYLDVDERAYLLDEKGQVVSAAEAVSRPQLWEPSARRVSPFYPQNGGLDGISELAKHGPPDAYWHWRTLGHTMDFALRPGESVTRYFKGQGHWRVDPSWQGAADLEILQTPPAGPKTPRRISVNNTYGNGLWVYQPQLSSRYRDFTEGVYRFDNLEQDARGLHLAQSGTGWAEWRVRTPYVIAGKPNDLLNPDDNTDAAAVTLTAAGEVTVCVSSDQGRHWEQAWSSAGFAGTARVDLTKWVEGLYEYHVRVELKGAPKTARLTALTLGTWTQLAPASLPRLKQYYNEMSFVWGDRRGDATEMFSLEPNFSDAADLKRWGVEVQGKYDPTDVSARARGPVTVKVTALAGTRLQRLHLGGSFNAYHKDAARPDRMLFSLDPNSGWKLLRQERPPDWVQHWYYNQEADLELNRPVTELWLKLDPAVAVDGLRVYAHCAPDHPEQLGPVIVTHTYRAGGKQHAESFRFTAPQNYHVFCLDEPENVSVTMAVLSHRK